MVQNQENRTVTVNSQMRGGNGSIVIEQIISRDEMGDKGRLYARLVIKPGCSIGYHTHEGETETFYMVRGVADYDDNGTPVMLKPGDMAFTPSGSGHSIANNGSEEVELMALILFV